MVWCLENYILCNFKGRFYRNTFKEVFLPQKLIFGVANDVLKNVSFSSWDYFNPFIFTSLTVILFFFLKKGLEMEKLGSAISMVT